VDNDGFADIVTGAGAGGSPHVKVFNSALNTEQASFFAYAANVTGGVRVAAGDIDGDARADIVTGAGPGGSPHVKVFSAATGAEIRSFFAYAAGFSGGVFVAAGDVNGDRRSDIITGPGGGGGSQVRVFSGTGAGELTSFFAYPGFFGGVSVGVADLNADGRADVLTGAGPGGGPHVKAFDLTLASSEVRSFFAFDPGFLGGVFVG
jgi:serralysin